MDKLKNKFVERLRKQFQPTFEAIAYSFNPQTRTEALKTIAEICNPNGNMEETKEKL